jgi:E3 ubiquitin-protein ligase SIAH1
VAHLRDEHSVDMHEGSTFNHRYIKRNPEDVENATWMLTVSSKNRTNTSYSRLVFF